MIKIVVDLMGADKPTNELVSGSIKAINENKDLTVVFCAKEEVILPVLDTLTYNKEQVEIVNCTEEITNNDIPTKAFRKKPDSSLVKGLNICKNHPLAGGFVSCGSTGAVLVSSMFILGRIGEVRPCLACLLLGNDGEFLISDCGAYVDCKPEQIVDFAKMGVAYMKAKGIENPRVRLRSNGAEEKKGPDAIKEANQMLKASGLNFLGNVEGKDILASTCDVVAADGFGGNTVIKTIEGTAKALFMDLLAKAKASTSEAEALVLKKTVKELMAKYDYNTLGGANLLGVTKPVIKVHGTGEAETFYNMIKEAYALAKGNMIGIMEKLLTE
jgi:glycerol-3-phosphate acyltransferase PlsX